MYLSNIPQFLQTKKKILHTAPESVLFKLFSENGNFDYFPIDKFAPGYEYPQGTIDMDILNLKFPDNNLDFIFSSHVLEHIENDIAAMKEFYRVLSPDGFAILQVPIDPAQEKTYEDTSITDPEDRLKAFGQHDHVRMYGLDYKERLESVGFKVEIDNFSVLMSPEDRFKYGFGKGESLYIVRK